MARLFGSRPIKCWSLPGVRGRRDIVRHTGSVVILAVDESHAEPRVLLVRQYRHAAQQYLVGALRGPHR